MGAIIPSIGSHQNSAVKRAWARVVLGWVTSWGVLVLPTFFGVFFFFNSTDLSRFIFCRRWMRPDQEEEKASKSDLRSMFTQNYQIAPLNVSWPENLRGVMKVV